MYLNFFLQRKRYPLGFYMVLVVKSTDEDCTGFSQNSSISHFGHFFELDSQPYDVGNAVSRSDFNENRLKNVKIHIKSSISTSEYWIASVTGILVIVTIYIIFLSGLFCYKYKPVIYEESEPGIILIFSYNCTFDREFCSFSLIHTWSDTEWVVMRKRRVPRLDLILTDWKYDAF